MNENKLMQRFDVQSIECEEESGVADDKPPSRSSSHLENDWRWQLKNRITTKEHLENIIGSNSNICDKVFEKFQFGITPYVLSLVKKFDETDPIFKMYFPCSDELVEEDSVLDDPLSEEEQMPVPRLVHRYSDRALILTTSFCSNYCRYCTRKRCVGESIFGITDKELADCREYIIAHPEINDVILSGGDILCLSNEQIHKIISTFYDIKHVSVIRIGTKTVNVLPQRFNDDELLNILGMYDKIWINTHFNHPNEITEEVKIACKNIQEMGIIIQNQSVLLKGINDDPKVYLELCKKLLAIKVKPYYLFNCDIVKGVHGFRTKVQTGLDILKYMKGKISGFGIPNFVVDAPEGKGKIYLTPNNIVEMNDKRVVLVNYKGQEVDYIQAG